MGTFSIFFFKYPQNKLGLNTAIKKKQQKKNEILELITFKREIQFMLRTALRKVSVDASVFIVPGSPSHPLGLFRYLVYFVITLQFIS